MKISAKSPDEYVNQLPDDRQRIINKLRDVILKNLPKGFSETIGYGMIGYVVPLDTYPEGYHCNPSLPLPFINLASQKNFVALYHMGIYSSPPLLEWFTSEYKKYTTIKLDMGKSCIRFKKEEHIPFQLIGELCSKITMEQWIEKYESVIKKK